MHDENEKDIMEDDGATHSEVEELINEGKKHGFVTHDDIENHLPDEAWDADTIDSIFTNLNEMGIDVVDKSEIEKMREQVQNVE